METSGDTVAVNLKDGHVYVDGYGGRHRIVGTCRFHPEWCWATSGEWFERSTGTAIAYDLATGDYKVGPASWRNLWKEVR